MLRIVLTIVLPLILPTVLYLLWARFARRVAAGAAPWSAALPWLWLIGAGVLLLAFVLFTITVHYGTSEPGTYVPAQWRNGVVIPGHIRPAEPAAKVPP
jgi:RsiW-degrading membrane proteinase PrsW (M82 family)